MASDLSLPDPTHRSDNVNPPSSSGRQSAEPAGQLQNLRPYKRNRSAFTSAVPSGATTPTQHRTQNAEALENLLKRSRHQGLLSVPSGTASPQLSVSNLSLAPSSLAGVSVSSDTQERIESSLDQFNVDSFLGKLAPESAAVIEPGTPEFFLRQVRRSKKMPDNLRALASHHNELVLLALKIKTGAWSLLSGPTDDPAFDKLDKKDALHYLWAAGAITEQEFSQGITELAVQAQHGDGEKPFVVDLKFEDGQPFTLPVRTEDVDCLNLFDRDGELSGPGEEYLLQVADNLMKATRFTGLHQSLRSEDPSHERETLIKRLKEAAANCPENLRMFHMISWSAAPAPAPRDHDELKSEPDDRFWQRQVNAQQMPFNACPSKADDFPNQVHNLAIYVPSIALHEEFLKLVNPEHPVKLAPCLGRTSGEQLATLNLANYRPGIVVHKDIKTNNTGAHGHTGGELDLWLHDLFHCATAANYSPEQVQLLCGQLVPLVKQALINATPYEKSFSRRLVEHLADLAEPEPQKLAPHELLNRAFNNANNVVFQYPTDEDHQAFIASGLKTDDDARQVHCDVLEKVLTSMQTLQPETWQAHDWSGTQTYLDQKRSQFAMQELFRT